MENEQNKIIETVLKNVEPTIKTVGKAGDGSAQVLLVPKGMEAFAVKKYLNEYLENPERRKGTIRLDRLDSFIQMTNRFKAEASVVFAKGEIGNNSIRATLTTVFDYHPAGEDNKDARNCDHRAQYSFPVSKDFSFWIENNGQAMNQGEFALLLEERSVDMINKEEKDFQDLASLSPKFANPLEVISLSRDLEIYSTEQVKQAGKLSSGEREIKFSAVHNGADGKPVNIPDFFVISVPIFEGGERVKIAVRLRYRKKESGILWYYDLYRIDRVFDEAFDLAVKAVREGTELPVFLGSPAQV